MFFSKPPKPFISSLNKISPSTQNQVREFSKRDSDSFGFDYWPDFFSAQNIDSPTSKPVPKVLTTGMRNFSGNPIGERNLTRITRIKILISELLARTTNKSLQISIHKKRYLLQTSPTMTQSIVKFFHKILFIKAVHHVQETILCPRSDHLPFFFSVTASLFSVTLSFAPPTTVLSHIQ